MTKKEFIKNLGAFVLCAAIAAGCGKDPKNDPTPEPEPDPAKAPALTTTAVSAITANTATAGGNISDAGTPAYTERGVVYATTAAPTSGDCIFVSDGDVYVAGSKTWKNGEVLYDNWEYSIFVSGSDVYVLGGAGGANGQGGYEPLELWTNGVVQYLTDDKIWVRAYSVFVSGSDVSVAGCVGTRAVLWKNGVEQKLTNGSNVNVDAAEGRSVFVSGNDVYVAGWEYSRLLHTNVPKLWKNGVSQSLTGGSNNGEALSVFVV